MDGILIIDKPAGITSHDVVARCRRILRTKRIGHTGTLDPFATGVVVILIEKATRLAQFLDKDVKDYEAVTRFGFETDTGDKTGELRVTNYKLRDVSLAAIKAVLPEFRGEILQTPPMYSAKKVEGKKLYELARKGIEIERKAVKVNIYELEVTKELENNEVDNNSRIKTQDFGFTVSCSAGTYIRTLAEDIGKKLGSGAHLTELRRIKAGKFSVENAVTLETLEEMTRENRLGEILVSMNRSVSHLAETVLASDEITKLKNGMKLGKELKTSKDGDFIRLTDGETLLAVGIYSEVEKKIQPKMVLV